MAEKGKVRQVFAQPRQFGVQEPRKCRTKTSDYCGVEVVAVSGYRILLLYLKSKIGKLAGLMAKSQKDW